MKKKRRMNFFCNIGGSRKFPRSSFTVLSVVFFFTSIQSQGDIIEVVNLVREPNLLQWENRDGEKIVFGNEDLTVGIAKESYRPVRMWSHLDGAYYIDYMQDKVIEVQPQSTMGRKNTSVRGIFETTLPDIKRIQLEFTYDLDALDEETVGMMDMYVEVHEKMGGENSETWIKTGEFHNPTFVPGKKSKHIINFKDHLFTLHNFVAIISEWRGKKVRLVFVSEALNSVETSQKGYWRLIRLVGLSFDIIVGPSPNQPSQSEGWNYLK